MKILAIVPTQVDGCVYHRIEIPLINLKGFELGQVNQLDGMKDDQLKEWGVVWVNRLNGIVDVYKQVERLKRLGVKLVVDFDDALKLPKNHLLYDTYKKFKATEQLVYLARQADYIFTTHDYLAKTLKRFNKKVEVVPNAIDPEQPQWQTECKLKDATAKVFGWCGGIHHYNDLRLLLPALKEIHESNDVYRLMLGGYVDGSEIWERYAGWFDNDGKYKHTVVVKGLDVYNYATLYDYMTTTLIPLVNDEFNRCKSELKMIEAGFKKKAVIVSAVHPYTNLINVDNCIKIDNDKPEQWLRAIKRINESKDLEQQLANELYQSVVVKHNIKNVNKIREQVFKTL